MISEVSQSALGSPGNSEGINWVKISKFEIWSQKNCLEKNCDLNYLNLHTGFMQNCLKSTHKSILSPKFPIAYENIWINLRQNEESLWISFAWNTSWRLYLHIELIRSYPLFFPLKKHIHIWSKSFRGLGDTGKLKTPSDLDD